MEAVMFTSKHLRKEAVSPQQGQSGWRRTVSGELQHCLYDELLKSWLSYEEYHARRIRRDNMERARRQGKKKNFVFRASVVCSRPSFA